jgi:hypothetical protein
MKVKSCFTRPGQDAWDITCPEGFSLMSQQLTKKTEKHGTRGTRESTKFELKYALAESYWKHASHASHASHAKKQ